MSAKDQPSTLIQHPASNRISYFVFRPLILIFRHICRFVLGQETFAQQPFATRHSLLLTRHSSLVTRHSSFITRHSYPLLLCFLLFVGCAPNLPLTELPFLATATPPPTIAPTAVPIVVPTPDLYSITGLRTFLENAAAARLADRQDLVNRYMALMPPTPLVSQDSAAIVYQGAGGEVAVVGDMNNWSTPTPLERVPDTDLWVLILPAEPDARLDYLLVVDGQERLDPRNPLTEVNPLGLRSKLVMPAYTPPAGDGPTAAVGQTNQHVLESAVLNQTRTLFVYSPAGSASQSDLPLVIFLDGTDHINLIDTPGQLDRLIEAGNLPPLIAVFVPPIDRSAEYELNDTFVSFLADEVVPFTQRNFSVTTDPDKTVLVGQNAGGATAVYAALAHPELFGRVISQSGLFTLRDSAILRQIALREAIPLELYLTVGTYETNVAGDNVVATHQALAERLSQNGIPFTLDQQPEGHSWGLWRDRLGPALGKMVKK